MEWSDGSQRSIMCQITHSEREHHGHNRSGHTLNMRWGGGGGERKTGACSL